MSEPRDPVTSDAPIARLTCARLKEWVMAAQPNARLVYARGINTTEGCSPALKACVLALDESGYLTAHFIRGPRDEMPSYIVQRTRRPVLKGAVL